MMKKILNIKVIISVILIVSALIFVFLPNDCCLKDYKENAVTELLSILITVVIIDFFIQKKNEKEKKENKQREILRLHNLFNIYLMQYKEAYIRIFGNEELKYSDMSKLLKPSPTRFILSTKPAYHDFFRLWKSLFHQAEEYISKLDLGEDNELIDILSAFVADNIFIDTLQLAYQQRESILYGKEAAFKWDIEQIEKSKEKYKITDIANIQDLYSITFDLLVRNTQLIQMYDDLMSGLDSAKLRKVANETKV